MQFYWCGVLKYASLVLSFVFGEYKFFLQIIDTIKRSGISNRLKESWFTQFGEKTATYSGLINQL